MLACDERSFECRFHVAALCNMDNYVITHEITTPLGEVPFDALYRENRSISGVVTGSASMTVRVNPPLNSDLGA